LSPVDWKLSVDLIVEEKSGKKKNDIEARAGLAFQRIYFWLDTNLPSVIVTDVSDEDDLYVANLSANIMMYCPGSSGDDMIIRLLHSKLSSISSTNIIVGEMKLKSSDSTLQYTFDCQDGNYELPATTTDYYAEGTPRDEAPWWTRNDGFCFEFIKPEDSKLSDEELYKDVTDPMDEFERLMEASSTITGMIKEPAKIVQVEKWKPKTV
jgi:hypothetical protein